MSTIIIHVKQQGWRKEAQHVVDLDTAVFTCNWCLGYSWTKEEGVQDHFIRGIVIPYKMPIFNNKFPLHFSSCEILVKDLPEEDQKKIYSLYDDQMLDDVWRMIRDTNERYEPGWLLPERYYSVRNQYVVDRKCPLMLVERVSNSHDAPIIIQPNAILCGSFIDWKLKLCTLYGKCNFDLAKWRAGYERYRDLYWKASRLDQVFALPRRVSNQHQA